MKFDISKTIEPRSDQQNYEDYIAGPKVVTISAAKRGSQEQPVELHLEEFPGRPYKPNRSMRRVLVAMWGKDASKYVGRQLKLYGDPDVRFGGEAVGGIKIAAMSHIDKAQSIPLTVTRGKRRPFRVEPLTTTPTVPTLARQEIEEAATVDVLRGVWGQATPEQQARIKQRVQELQGQ